MTFDQALEHGKLGESIIAQWLLRRGWSVLPAYEKEPGEFKGPVLYRFKLPSLVSPDLLIFKPGDVRWIEAKRKSAFTWFRKTSTWQTGIDSHHFAQYLEIRRLSALPVYLMFLHENGIAKDTPPGMVSPTGLYCGEIEEMAACKDHESALHGAHGMTYWNIGDLHRMASLEKLR